MTLINDERGDKFPELICKPLLYSFVVLTCWKLTSIRYLESGSLIAQDLNRKLILNGKNMFQSKMFNYISEQEQVISTVLLIYDSVISLFFTFLYFTFFWKVGPNFYSGRMLIYSASIEDQRNVLICKVSLNFYRV